MKFLNLYEVTFDTKKGFPKSWVIHVSASTEKEARGIAEKMWSEDSRMNEMHMFHIKVRRLSDHDEFKWHYFAIVGK